MRLFDRCRSASFWPLFGALPRCSPDRPQDHGARRARRRLGPDRALDAAGADFFREARRRACRSSTSPAPAAASVSRSSSTAQGRRQPADGQRLVMVGALLTNKSPVPLDQATPIAKLTEEVAGDRGAGQTRRSRTRKDLAAAVKADVAKVTWTGGSAGGVDHITAALFAQAVGADSAKVNYIAFSGGGESLAAILGGTRHRRHFRLRRIRRPDQVRHAARDRRHRRQAACPASTSRPSRNRASIVVISNWRSVMAPPGTDAAAARRSHRAGREDGEVAGLEGHPQAEGLGRRL